MKRNAFLFLGLASLFIIHSCNDPMVTDLRKNNIMPLPQRVEANSEVFKINKNTSIIININENAPVRIAEELGQSIKNVSGFDIEVKKSKSLAKSGSIVLNLIEKDSSPEWYQIDINKKQIVFSAVQEEGLFRALQTFMQLLTLEGSDVLLEEKNIFIPGGVIEDYPEYAYRGAMLDVARHFFGPNVVKQYIDMLAIYKINFLHLHLSDDQGWRIEIKSWPALTEIGGSTEVGGGEGGYFTQEEYKDLIAYAAERFITIIPEIDMPGHTNAALASYAELNCNGKATELYTGTHVGFSTLCTSNEITYKFVDDVVREISEMTPGPYFHIGGDESHVTELPDYIYFVNRVKAIVQSHDKILMGWDEISHGDLAEGDIAQYWASSENAKRAVEKGARLLISPAKKCYLDMKYNESTTLGLDWGGYIEVDAAYNWNPATLVEGIGKEHILGVESPLWGETIESFDDIEFLAFPRLIGHAEIGWSNSDSLSWESYRSRLVIHGKLLDKMGVNYYKSKTIDW